MMRHIRNRMIKRVLTLLLTFSVTPFFTSCDVVKEDNLPNIVIIFTDDLGYGDIGCYGAEGFTTPHIDKMANEGMRFTDFRVSTAVCSASRASLLTGCYSERVSIRGALNHASSIGLNPEEENIAEMLKKKDYKTAIFGKWHLGHHEEFLPMQQGFDEYYGLPYSNDMWPVHYDGTRATGRKSAYPELRLIEGNDSVGIVGNLEDQNKLTTAYTEKAVDFINRNADERFFLYLAHSMPHVPLGVSEKYKGKSEQGFFGDVVMEIDWSVGEVLKTLKENGIENNTLVIFTSDNGPWLNYGNHAGSAGPLREGKGTMWEGGVRVPCVMRWPDKIKQNIVTDKFSSTIDILPTIAAITDSDLPEKKIDGVNILPVLLDEIDVSPREEFWYYYDYDLIAVRKNEWKLFFPSTQRSYEGLEPGMDGFPGPTRQKKIDYQLYNLKEDLGEQNNVIDNYPDIVEELKKIGDRARYELGDRLTQVKGEENREPGRIGARRLKSVRHTGMNKELQIKTVPSKRYGYGQSKILLDGWKGTLDFNDGRWLGFEGDDFEAVIDLGEQKKINEITASFLQSQGSWIFLPQSVSYAVSRDGKKFEDIAEFEENIEPSWGNKAKDYSKRLDNQNARYIRISAKNIRSCPDWHQGKGGKAWMFIDEIIVD